MTAMILWLIGYLYACGYEQKASEMDVLLGSESRPAWIRYGILFLGWPAYLGYQR